MNVTACSAAEFNAPAVAQCPTPNCWSLEVQVQHLEDESCFWLESLCYSPCELRSVNLSVSVKDGEGN